MTKSDPIYLINHFPDFNAPGFDIDRYNAIFKEHNVIINARSSNVEYDEHWGPLSLKCAFNGKEFYQAGKVTLAVDDSSYLIFNEGKYYSSYIRSRTTVDSFTVNFNPAFVQQAAEVVAHSDGTLLEEFGLRRGTPVRFSEQLYPHSETITPMLHRLRTLSKAIHANKIEIEELFHKVLVRLLLSQNDIAARARLMSPVRSSTKAELYKRLTAAKDFMHSCFHRNLTLAEISSAANLQSHYFLRQFKKNFNITPHQYLTRRRLEAARSMVIEGNISITDICLAVGFEDPASFSKLFKSRFGISPSVMKGSRN